MAYIWMRAVFTYWIATDLYIHLLNIYVRRDKTKKVLLTVICTLFTYLLHIFIGPFSIPFSLIVFLFGLLFTFRNGVKISIVVGLLAYGMGYVIYVINSFIVLEFILRLDPDFTVSFNTYLHIIVGLMSIIMVRYMFRIRRFRNGLKLNPQSGTIVSLFILGVMLYISISIAACWDFSSHMNKLIHFLLFSVSGFLFFVLWQIMITNYYRRRLRKIELDSFQSEIDELTMRNGKLLDDNEALARIIHRDNKLVPAMLKSVLEYLQYAAESPETADERGRELAERLKEMAKEREGILFSYESRRNPVAKTGHAGVDAVITYMYDRADAKGIRCEIKVDSGFQELIPNAIEEADCAHLLSDLMENAIIATARAENRKILVHLGILSGLPVIEISDSGVPFDPEVYQDFGNLKHSTHLDEGGSGIGLMDIWKLKRKYKASLHIHEFSPENDSYTKKLALVFDRKGHYLIQTYRHAEVAARKVRGDLYIIPMQ